MKTQELKKSIFIPKGTVANEVSTKVKLYGEWYEVIIPIGADNYAKFLLNDEALRALNKLKPEITII